MVVVSWVLLVCFGVACFIVGPLVVMRGRLRNDRQTAAVGRIVFSGTLTAFVATLTASPHAPLYVAAGWWRIVLLVMYVLVAIYFIYTVRKIKRLIKDNSSQG